MDMNKGTDINVGSIEEDIKRCEKLTKPLNANWIGISNQIAIAHVIERIKELEEHQQKFYNGEIYTAKQLKQVEENQKKYFINKQKVKEGLEDIEDYFDRLNGPDEDMEYIRNKKKELLEDK